MDEGMGMADSLLEAGASAIGASDYLGTDPFSSIMEKHSPFAEDEAELDAAESVWKVVQVRCEEGLNTLWRCELLLATPEVRNPDLEDELDQESSAGGLVDQVAGPIKGVIDTVDQIKGVFSNDPNAPPPESPLAKRVAGIKDATDRLKNADSLGDAIGAVSDIVFGAEESPTPDGPVYINIPLDPANFLGQTMSLRVSREFQTAPDSDHPNDVTGYSFSARYLTGVVVEMDDLGTRLPKLPPGIGSTQVATRHLRLVVMPELAKLSLRRDHRVFNRMHAISIVREVFRSAGVYGALPDIPGVGMATDALGDLASNIPFVGNTIADGLSGQFVQLMPPPSKSPGLAAAGAKLPVQDWTQEREMCVQYGETDLDFVRRLLEEEGIHFTFTCRRGFERIVLL
ncbi:MAG: contractile injection system protein, VgrG/Pvc8 family, partial [Sandaracinaceae bacterium]